MNHNLRPASCLSVDEQYVDPIQPVGEDVVSRCGDLCNLTDRPDLEDRIEAEVRGHTHAQTLQGEQ